MAYYSPETLDRVRAANDIVDVISSYIKLERKSNRYFGLCPFHNEKTGSFCVSSDSQLYHCFGCHESGNVISFLMKYENMEFPEAVESLAERAGIEIQSDKSAKTNTSFKKKREEMNAANKAAAEFYYRKLRDVDGERGLKYFKDRGLSSGIMNSFGLGYTGTGSRELYKHLKESGFSDELLKEVGLINFDEKNGIRDRFFSRVMFPIMDVNRHVIGFGGRVLGDGQPKYINSSESAVFNKSETLYGLFLARRSRRKEFILCEGYMDVISAHMAGFDSAVATLGTALTEGHAGIIARFKRPVFLCYDSDEAGKKAAIRGYEILKNAGVSSKIIDLSPYKDPDEIIKAKGAEEFEKRIQNAKNALIVIMQWEYEKIDTNDPDAQTRFFHLLGEKISEYKDEAARENYINYFSRAYSISPDILRRTSNNLLINAAWTRDKSSPDRLKKRGIDREKTKRVTEATILAFMLEPLFFGITFDILEENDFTDEDFREIYRDIKAGYLDDSPPDAADIVSKIEDVEKRNLLSGILFGADREGVSEEDEKTLKRKMLQRLKEDSYRRAKSDGGQKDVNELQEEYDKHKQIMKEIENLDF